MSKVRKLLDEGANTNAKDGNTALIRASIMGHTEIMKVLLEAEADVNAKKKVGCLVIHLDGGKIVAWRS